MRGPVPSPGPSCRWAPGEVPDPPGLHSNGCVWQPRGEGATHASCRDVVAPSGSRPAPAGMEWCSFPSWQKAGVSGGEQRGWPCCGAGVTSLGLEGAGHGPPCPSVSPQRWGPSLVSTPHSRGVGPELAADPLPPVLIAPPPSLASCCPPKMAASGGRHVSPPPCPPQHGGGRHVVSLQCCQATGDAALPVAPSKAALGEASPHPDT